MILSTRFLAILMADHLPAAVLTYSGMFDSDDGVAFFGFTMDSPGTTEIRTLSAANGGFDPYLSLFDPPRRRPRRSGRRSQQGEPVSEEMNPSVCGRQVLV